MSLKTEEAIASPTGMAVKMSCTNEISPPIFVPASNVGVDLVITSGSATMQQTSGLPSEILAGTATWLPWSAGTVTTSTGSMVTGATAIRLNASAGVASLYVRY
jgi:hypothetical protein